MHLKDQKIHINSTAVKSQKQRQQSYQNDNDNIFGIH